MVILGNNLETNEEVRLDIDKLIATRLLIQASSGGGKSWLLRRVLELSHGRVQQIIIDLEGEYSTLREKFDYLLVGKEGDVPVSLKSAELLARKLLELNVSTIIDVSEMKKHERILFVKKFVGSLVDSPEKLWHACMVIVDEAHQFCPQGAKSESATAIIDLMTRGRKRGFCGVLATQRISKLNKDAAAEANNKLVGMTTLDIDRKRASDDLGFTSKQEEIGLRQLDKGVFYCYGPAISNEVVKVRVGGVQTTHPDRTKGIFIKPSPTPNNIKKLLKGLTNLPKEAEEELRNLRDLHSKISLLKRENLSLRKKSQIRVFKKKVSETDINKIREKAREEAQKELNKQINQVMTQQEKREREYQRTLSKLRDESYKQGYSTAEGLYSQKNKENQALIKEYSKKLESISKLLGKPLSLPKSSSPLAKEPNLLPKSQESPNSHVGKGIPLPITTPGFYDNNLGKCARTIYSFLKANPDKLFDKVKIGFMTGYSPRSGGFSNAITELNNQELIRKEGTLIGLGRVDPAIETEEGTEYSLNNLLSKLSKCAREIMQVLLENPDNSYSKEDLAYATTTQYSPTSGGFSNSITEINRLGAIIKEGGRIRLNPVIKEL